MKKQFLIPIIIGIFILVVLIWYFLPMYLTGLYCTVEQRGAYGDMYGSVNALFTALAFAGVIITLGFQLKELELTRNELSGQRQELGHQREQLEKQNETFKRQQFESTFFALLRTNIEIVSALVIVEGGKIRYSGKSCLALQKRSLENYMQSFCVDKSFDMLFEMNPPHLGHYFRQLYNIIKFVDDEGENKMRYANFMKAQLDNDELTLIAYNGASSHGKKFGELIEKYGLLENLEESDKNKVEKFYDKKAFGDK